MSKASSNIQYLGLPGITQECLDGLMRLIQYDDRIERARILSYGGSHALLLTVQPGDLFAIKAGFGDGYDGEGPRKFSYALMLLEALKVDIEEYEVGTRMMNHLNNSTLTEGDLAELKLMRPVRPQRYWNYIWEQHYKWYKEGKLWKEFRSVVPLSLIDSRITDLAITFWEHADDRLMTGYRRLEDIVRARTGLTEHGARLFMQAFGPNAPKLAWKGLGSAEQSARANLFGNAYSAHRNSRAHKEKDNHRPDQLSEFMLLNHLYLLERGATQVDVADGTKGEFTQNAA
jgi:Protein of unknown function (Hypoth_ymh)